MTYDRATAQNFAFSPKKPIGELRQRGQRIPDELLPYLSPLIWEHINR
jgi:hypothetical protein